MQPVSTDYVRAFIAGAIILTAVGAPVVIWRIILRRITFAVCISLHTPKRQGGSYGHGAAMTHRGYSHGKPWVTCDGNAVATRG